MTTDGDSEDLLRVNEALDVLAQAEPRLARVVEMRYFGGYTEVEIAEALDLTERTVRRDWDKARLLLAAMLTELTGDGDVRFRRAPSSGDVGASATRADHAVTS